MSKTELSIGSGRLRSIDALRGVAALAVMLFHAGGGFAGNYSDLPAALATGLSTLLSFGYTGVALFFVISGFCIHLRWAKAQAAGRAPQTDFVAFWKRRIFRLYPPYLIALGCYLFVLMMEGRITVTPFFGFDLGLHFVMLHNVLFDTAYSFNGPFWTLAIEEQLYLAYFLLLFLRRRFGWAWTLGICLAVRVAWFAIAQGVNPLLASWFGQPFYYQSHSFGVQMPINEGALFHWFIWALGAFAVEGALGLVKVPAWCRNLKLGFATLTAAAALAYVDRTTSATGVAHYATWLAIDPLWGLGFFCVVNAAVAREHRWRLSARVPRTVAALAAVGIFSYSLYLMHEFVLAHFLRMTSSWAGVPENQLTIFSLLVLAPACVAFAWVFFQLFERPFIPKSAATALEPTPTARWQSKAAVMLRRAAIVITLLFVFAEIGLRVYDRIHPVAVFQDDSYNLFRGRPFAPDYNFRLNSRGFKDVEFRQQKEDGSRRIVSIGGSCAYGAPPYQHTYLTLLEQRLNQAGGQVEVINMGIPYLRLKDYFSLLVREGLALQPDRVIVSFSMASDLAGDNEEPRIRSYVTAALRSLRQTRRRYDGVIYNGASAYEDDQPTMLDGDYLQQARARSRLYSESNDALAADVAEATNRLARMKRLCDANGIEFTVVLIPDEVQVDRALQSQVGGMRDVARPNRLLAERLNAERIDCVDMLDEVARAAAGARLYKPNDGRWNIAGNRLAAEILERHLSARLTGAAAGVE